VGKCLAHPLQISAARLRNETDVHEPRGGFNEHE
jgi:hypothetical protein